MNTLVYGSINIDKTYLVHHLVQPGETQQVSQYEVHYGGKGLNQSIALSRGGAHVFLTGAIGADGIDIITYCNSQGISTDYVKQSNTITGHAVIQVDESGQNSILIVPGANQTTQREELERVINLFSKGDYFLVQNEVPYIDYAIEQAKRRGMVIALNPSPCNDAVLCCNLHYVDYLLINEVEGKGLTGFSEANDILLDIRRRYPELNTVLTVGRDGVHYLSRNGTLISYGAYHTNAIDTTGAGDTFAGYFLSTLQQTGNVDVALQTATIASGISVSAKGAAESIPEKLQVLKIDRSSIPCIQCVNIDKEAD